MALPVAHAGAGVDGKHLNGPFSVLPADIVLAGTGTPGTGGSSITDWKWYLDIPDGVVATIDDDTLQNPTVTVTSGYGTIMALLVVTDDQAAESVGPDDIASVPNESLCAIECPYPNTNLVAPGTAERNTMEKHRALFAEVDEIRGDLTDHTTGSIHASSITAAQLDALKGGGSAAGYHTHPGTDISTWAAVGTGGKIELAEAPLDAGHPKALTRDRIAFSDHFAGTVSVRSSTPSQAQAAWKFSESMKLHAYDIHLRDGGGTGGTNNYEFTFYKMTATQYIANDFAGAVSLFTISITKNVVANEPMISAATVNPAAVGISFAAAEILAVKCTLAPDTPGADLTVVAIMVKEY